MESTTPILPLPTILLYVFSRHFLERQGMRAVWIEKEKFQQIQDNFKMRPPPPPWNSMQT